MPPSPREGPVPGAFHELALKRRRQRLRLLDRRARYLPWLLVVVPILILGGIVLIAGPSRNSLDTGECLSTLERDDWDGYLVVDCADPTAAYVIVTKVKGESRSELDACAGHPEGTPISRSYGRKPLKFWQVCAVPKSGS